MSPLELLEPETVDAAPFSVRLAERRRQAAPTESARADRRAHLRRSARDLDWLQAVRLTGDTSCDARIVDLSEGGALIEVSSPLRPGVTLTLEMSGPGVDMAVPLEVLRCYIANLRGETATYRGACAFVHVIDMPGHDPRPARATAEKVVAGSNATSFVGTEAALTYLLERCARPRHTIASGAPGITLERTEVLQVLDALQARTSSRGSDVLSRHASDLLAAILPALRAGAPRDVAVAALEERMRALPQRWHSLLQSTTGRLVSLVDHCATAVDASGTQTTSSVSPTDISNDAASTQGARSADLAVEPAGHTKSAFQKIVVRQADGRIFKGFTQDFHPARPQFSLWPSINATPKERIVVAVARLKAVFYVKDFNGNPEYQERKAFGARGPGRRVEVTFADGETLVGTTLNYRPDAQGFFVSPVDPAANNTRVFVVSKGLRRVRFL